MVGRSGNSLLPFAYIPSNPEEGKCHKIRVTVDRHDPDVYSTDQYCYTTNLATDPLNGTKFGRQMDTDLTSNKSARIPLVMRANFFYSNSQMARVDIVLEFPWNQLEHQFTLRDLRASIGVSGVAYKEDRTVATQFTDFGCCASGTRWFANPLVEAGNLPSRYETQIDLPPEQNTILVSCSVMERTSAGRTFLSRLIATTESNWRSAPWS